MRFAKCASALALLATFALVGTVQAQEQAQSKEIKGVLIDKMCGNKMAKKADPQAAAEKHSKECCVSCGTKSGQFGIMSDGKLLLLDKKSNEMAKDYIKKDSSTTDVVVDGKMVDGKLEISSIKPAEKSME